MEQTFSEYQVRTALGAWLLDNNITGRDANIPNVESYLKVLKSLVLHTTTGAAAITGGIIHHGIAKVCPTDPAELEACEGCQ